jgi:hypothetical protein
MNNLEVKILEIWGENKALRGQEDAYKEKKDELLSQFATLVGANTEEGFDKLYKKLPDDYSGVPFILEYIKNGPMKHVEEWAKYTCQYLPSFGQCSTSWLESSHGRLKRSLVNRSGHPHNIVKDMHQLIQHERNEHKARVDAAQVCVTTSANILHFQKLHTCVTPASLALLRTQIELAKDLAFTPNTCTGAFTAEYNLPCCHQLYVKLCNDPRLMLSPDNISKHWHFYPS